MKEELLIQIREELEREKCKIIEMNSMLKRIRELEKNPEVKEYIKLRKIDKEDSKIEKIKEDELIEEIYYHYLHRIRKEDTNGIYVYIGTYRYTTMVDIVHTPSDIRVRDDDESADYRAYKNIEEYLSSIQVPISRCKEFEENSIVIYPGNNSFYQVQKEFFRLAVKNGQESAKRRILKKYTKK